jgi:hypothetical protein
MRLQATTNQELRTPNRAITNRAITNRAITNRVRPYVVRGDDDVFKEIWSRTAEFARWLASALCSRGT